MKHAVFTIGHSTHSREAFVHLLQQHGITAVCDVRSKPYSRLNPQFNREELEESLKTRGIAYRFLGRELGARSDDPTCYEDGRVQYGRLAETDLFKHGLRRVLRGVREEYRIVIMCAEKEPLECHRTILVARSLAAQGVHVEHIHPDGHLESHEDAQCRLVQMYRLTDSDMFRSSEDILADAYRRQEQRIAYEQPTPAMALTTKGRDG